MGRTYHKLGCYNQALTSFNKAILLNPQAALAYSGKGKVLNDMKEPREALIAVKQALKIQPELEEAQTLFKTIMGIEYAAYAATRADVQAEVKEVAHSIGMFRYKKERPAPQEPLTINDAPTLLPIILEYADADPDDIEQQPSLEPKPWCPIM